MHVCLYLSLTSLAITVPTTGAFMSSLLTEAVGHIWSSKSHINDFFPYIVGNIHCLSTKFYSSPNLLMSMAVMGESEFCHLTLNGSLTMNFVNEVIFSLPLTTHAVFHLKLGCCLLYSSSSFT